MLTKSAKGVQNPTRFGDIREHFTLERRSEAAKESGCGLITVRDVDMSTIRSAITPSKSGLRVLLVVLLGLASLIPLGIVDGVASERRGYFDQAQHEVADSWGLPQELTGPVLVVPVDYTPIEPVEGWADDAQALRARSETTRKHVVLLPDELTIDSVVDYEIRERAIYRVALFSADVNIGGAFREARSRIEEYVNSLSSTPGVIDFTGAKLVFGVSDPRAIRLRSKSDNNNGAGSAQSVLWGDTSVVLEATSMEAIIGTGVQVPVTLAQRDAETSQDPDSTRFELQMALGTTQRLALNALGGNTRYTLNSNWPHPSFNGAHSPVHREIRSDGFSADWEVHGLARNLPDIWIHENRPRSLSGQQMGVSFYNPVTTYTIIDRGIKYGLLFIALTFLTFLCFELSGGAKFHAVQYAVVSAGLIMFYMTLLAASEHLNFGVSYVLATGLIVGLLGAYTWAMTATAQKQRLLTATIVNVLLGLYATLFVLLQLEDYALLMGTALLLLGLAALMYATRNLHRRVE